MSLNCFCFLSIPFALVAILFCFLAVCGPVRSGPGVFDLSVSLTPSLVVLVALNMLLFYKLYALERAAHTLERWHSYSVADR